MKTIQLLLTVFVVCTMISFASTEEDKTLPPGFVGYDELQGQVYRGNLRRDGVFKTTGVPKAKGIRWASEAVGPIKSSPVCVDGVIYVGSDDKNFYALNAKDGSVKWTFKTKTPVLGSAAVVGGLVFFSSGTHAYAVEAATGVKKWSSKVGKRNAFGSPAVAYGIAFFPGGASKNTPHENSWGGWLMNGFDVLSGKNIWKQGEGRGPQGFSSPILIDGKLIYTDGTYCKMTNLKEGKFDWVSGKTPWHSAQLNTPALSEGHLFYIGTYGGDQHGMPLNGELHVISAKTGKHVWKIHPWEGTNEEKIEKPKDGKDHSVKVAATVAEGLVFTADASGEVRGLDYKKKKRVWLFNAESGISSTPSYFNGLLVFGSDDGTVYALQAETGVRVWKIKCGDKEIVSSPWIDDGVIYIASTDGKVYAIE